MHLFPFVPGWSLIACNHRQPPRMCPERSVAVCRPDLWMRVSRRRARRVAFNLNPTALDPALRGGSLRVMPFTVAPGLVIYSGRAVLPGSWMRW